VITAVPTGARTSKNVALCLSCHAKVRRVPALLQVTAGKKHQQTRRPDVLPSEIPQRLRDLSFGPHAGRMLDLELPLARQ
jgi:hypothetical protein